MKCRIIKAHVKDDKVACAALSALTKMVTRCVPRSATHVLTIVALLHSKENAIFIVKSGGIDAALLLLNTHPDNAKVAGTVLEFFQKLAAHEDCVPMLVQAGAIRECQPCLRALSQALKAMLCQRRL